MYVVAFEYAWMKDEKGDVVVDNNSFPMVYDVDGEERYHYIDWYEMKEHEPMEVGWSYMPCTSAKEAAQAFLRAIKDYPEASYHAEAKTDAEALINA